MKTTTQGIIQRDKNAMWYRKIHKDKYVLVINGEDSKYTFKTWEDVKKDRRARTRSRIQIKNHNRKLSDPKRG